MNRKTALFIAAMVAAQVLAIWVYHWVEQGRRGAKEVTLSARPPMESDERFEAFEVELRDGSRFDLATVEEPTIVHFWASWCPPCRAELPLLLAWAPSLPRPVFTIALDERVEDIDAWTRGASVNRTGRVRRSRAADILDVRELPATLLIEPGGRITLRVQGARDWSNPSFRAAW